LRGRVGRGGEQSYCLLISRPVEELTETADARLDALVRTTDGFELAETDLESCVARVSSSARASRAGATFASPSSGVTGT